MRAFWIVAVLFTPNLANADLLRDLQLEGVYGKLGVETGYAFSRDRGGSPLVGVVGTLVHMNDELEWHGIQADFTIDGNGTNKAGGRWSIGPEAGVAIYGVDVRASTTACKCARSSRSGSRPSTSAPRMRWSTPTRRRSTSVFSSRHRCS
jgi:hypothetical protein